MPYKTWLQLTAQGAEKASRTITLAGNLPLYDLDSCAEGFETQHVLQVCLLECEMLEKES